MRSESADSGVGLSPHTPEGHQQHGHALESWGCPAIDDRVAPDVVARMADGALSLFWYPDGDWSENSAYLPR